MVTMNIKEALEVLRQLCELPITCIGGQDEEAIGESRPWKIVVLQRGHVVVGRYRRRGDEVEVIDAAVVRRWGTTKGLGELAALGPRPNTVLDPCGTVRAPHLGVVLTIDCTQSAWEGGATCK